MTTVLVAAHLQLCKCGTTATFKYSDGSESTRFATIKKGKELLECARVSEQVLMAEMPFCYDMLDRSGLPVELHEFDKVFAYHDIEGSHRSCEDRKRCCDVVQAA